jgi:DNA-binding transcriptional MocR family regulator
VPISVQLRDVATSRGLALFDRQEKARPSARVANAIRASASIVWPLTSAIASRWIETRLADAVRDEIVRESAPRLQVLKGMLPKDAETSPGRFHVWLHVEEPWTRGELVSRLRSVGVGVVGSDAFAVSKPSGGDQDRARCSCLNRRTET